MHVQFAPVVGDAAAERQRNLDILGKLAVKKPVLNVAKAVNTHMAAEERSSKVQVRVLCHVILPPSPSLSYTVTTGRGRPPWLVMIASPRGPRWEARQSLGQSQETSKPKPKLKY